jgi:hypothetical protein
MADSPYLSDSGSLRRYVAEEASRAQNADRLIDRAKQNAAMARLSPAKQHAPSAEDVVADRESREQRALDRARMNRLSPTYDPALDPSLNGEWGEPAPVVVYDPDADANETGEKVRQ